MQASQEPRVSPTLDSERPGTRKKPETTPASRIRRLRPKARGPTVRGAIDAVPEDIPQKGIPQEGILPEDTTSRRLTCPAGGSEESVPVVAGPVLPEGPHAEGPHALYDLALSVQASVHLVAGPVQGGLVEGLHLIGPLRSSGIAKRLVADVFQLPVAGLVKLLNLDLVPAGGAFDPHLAVALQ